MAAKEWHIEICNTIFGYEINIDSKKRASTVSSASSCSDDESLIASITKLSRTIEIQKSEKMK